MTSNNSISRRLLKWKVASLENGCKIEINRNKNNFLLEIPFSKRLVYIVCLFNFFDVAFLFPGITYQYWSLHIR